MRMSVRRMSDVSTPAPMSMDPTNVSVTLATYCCLIDALVAKVASTLMSPLFPYFSHLLFSCIFSLWKNILTAESEGLMRQTSRDLWVNIKLPATRPMAPPTIPPTVEDFQAHQGEPDGRVNFIYSLTNYLSEVCLPVVINTVINIDNL